MVVDLTKLTEPQRGLYGAYVDDGFSIEADRLGVLLSETTSRFSISSASF